MRSSSRASHPNSLTSFARWQEFNAGFAEGLFYSRDCAPAVAAATSPQVIRVHAERRHGIRQLDGILAWE
jgi:hypothetical protein